MYLLIILFTTIVSSLQEPIFLPPPTTFKGLPRLANFNLLGGETRAVYYHDQIVGIVDLGINNELHHCELIEVYEPNESEEILKNLSITFRPQQVSFAEMLRLMHQCDLLDDAPMQSLEFSNLETQKSSAGNPLFVGIIPGTKWCGTGDIAKNYHDLGSRFRIDRCCRAHDLCPVKIRAYKARYNLVNYSFFSRSHCTCDEAFYECLKNINHVAANIIGNIYFNIAQPTCLEDDPTDVETKKFVPMKRGF